jgi:FkbM family methyltransferase
MLLAHFPLAVSRLGWAGALKLLTSRRRLRRWLPEWTERVVVRGYPHPFHFRHATTDKYIIAEVLLSDQYDCLRGLPNVRTIIDVGANIGTTAVFLLNAYPEATLVALEPDPGNFAVLERNLRYYGRRAIALRTALWYRPEGLVIDRGHFRDGGEWSFQVKSRDSSADAEVQGLTVPEILKAYEIESLDILKVDIEGAERFVFENADCTWIHNVKRIAIELHDVSSRDAFIRAISRFPGDLSRHGEVTFWQKTAASRTGDVDEADQQ